MSDPAEDFAAAIKIMVGQSSGSTGAVWWVLYAAGDGHRPILTTGFKTEGSARTFALELILRTRDDVTWSPQAKPAEPPEPKAPE